MSNDNKTLGIKGEAAAVSFLKKQDFTILETNYRTKSGEIDIIAKEGDTTCFIEVKTRRSLKKGLPKEAITWAKQQKIIQSATFYLKKKGLLNSRIRFDVIEVREKDNIFDINLIKHAFQAR